MDLGAEGGGALWSGASMALPSHLPSSSPLHTSQAVVRALDAGAADPSSTSTTNTNTSSSASSPFLAEKLTLLLLLKRPEEWKLGVAWPNEAVAAQWAALMDLTHMTVVEAEVGSTGLPCMGSGAASEWESRGQSGWCQGWSGPLTTGLQPVFCPLHQVEEAPPLTSAARAIPYFSPARSWRS